MQAARASVNVGRGNQHRQQQAQAVHPDVAFTPLDLLAVVEAMDGAAAGRGLDRLAIDSRRAWAGVAAGLEADLLPQGLVDFVPGAVAAPAAVPGVDGTPGREVVGQQAPLAAAADQVEDAVDHFAEVGGRPAHVLASGQEWLDKRELGVGKVGFIVLEFHPVS